MRKRSQIALTVLLVGLVSLIAWHTLRRQEPVYLGKSFTFWLERYCWNFRADSVEGIEERNQAEAAILQIGTNGLPVLVSMIKAINTRWKDTANDLLREQSQSSFRFSQAEDNYGAAVQGFILLRENAVPAVPALIELLSNRNPEVRAAAVRALGAIKPEPEQAVPALVDCITDTNQWVRFYAICAVGDIHRQAGIVVPALIGNLQSPDPVPAAIAALAKFGDAARSAHPTLLPFLNDPELGFRMAATNALKAIDPALVP